MPLKLIYRTKLYNNARSNFLNKRKKKLIGVATSAPAPIGRRLLCFGSTHRFFPGLVFYSNHRHISIAANHAKHSPVKDCSGCFFQ